ncbi:hypothetical protein [Pseudorhodoplanes sp.]|uniref:hypothetical protein n=1 Tax=Pseudorhodoplanes sp. TaxID=1934341 RepID=UPI003D14DDE0
MRYLVKFMKHVRGDNGYEVDICQRWLEVDANSKSAALSLAKKQFCAAERVRDWTTHADRIQITEAEYPS